MSISILFSHLGALYTCLHATELVSTLERLRDLAKHAIILTLLRYSSFYHIIRSCQEWTVRLIGIRCDSALRTDWVIKYAPSDGRSMTSNISYVKAGGLEIRSVTCTLLKLPEFLTSVRGAHYPAIKCTIGDTFPVLTPYYKWDSGILYFHKLGPRWTGPISDNSALCLNNVGVLKWSINSGQVIRITMLICTCLKINNKQHRRTMVRTCRK